MKQALKFACALVAFHCAFAWCARAQTTATCWPVPSNLKKYNSYFCAIDAPPGGIVTGRQLMASLAELEPLPESLAAKAGGDQNRISPQNVTNLTEKYILPGISAATALDGIKIKETHWQTLIVLSPILFQIAKGLILGTAEPEWSQPPDLTGSGEIPLDSRGQASAALYTRKEGGVRRVSLAVQTASRPISPTGEHGVSGWGKGENFRPASWYTLLVEAEARTAEQRDRDRIADIAWREFESWDPRYLAEAK